MEEDGGDGLPYMNSSRERCSWLDSSSSLERLDGEIKRHTNVGGILPNAAGIRWLVAGVLAEQAAEWSLWRAEYTSLSA